MSRRITYFYSHVSPWSYLGHQRLAAIAARAGVEIEYVPVSTGMIFPTTGGVPLPKRSPERRAYRMAELRRWPQIVGVPLNPEPAFFPVDDKPAGRLALLAQSKGHPIAELSLACMRACWVEDRDLADLSTLTTIADATGLDGRTLLGESEGEAGQALLTAASERAVSEGCFGVPWYIVDGEPFWGQDRLDLVERVLAR